METSDLFQKWFGDTPVVDIKNPNVTSFFEDLKRECLEEDLKNGKRKYYSPSDSYEYYNADTNTWYNSAGQKLRDPSEYDSSTEGYTPLRDE